MPTVKHTILPSKIKEISSSAGSLFVMYGELKVMISDIEPTAETFIAAAHMQYGDNNPFKVKSGEKLYVMHASGDYASFSYTEA